jgi:hypothetical protein
MKYVQNNSGKYMAKYVVNSLGCYMSVEEAFDVIVTLLVTSVMIRIIKTINKTDVFKLLMRQGQPYVAFYQTFKSIKISCSFE